MFLVGFILTIWFVAYIVLPERVTGKKYEYITCLGSSMAIFFILFVLVTRVLLVGDRWRGIDSNVMFCLSYWIFFSFYHIFYPFRKVERNKNLSFLLLGTSLPFLLFWLVAWGLVAVSNM